MTDDERRVLLAERRVVVKAKAQFHEKRGDSEWGNGYDVGYKHALKWVRDNLDLGEKK